MLENSNVNNDLERVESCQQCLPATLVQQVTGRF